MAGEAAAYVQASPHGERLKAVAVDLERLSQLPVHLADAMRPPYENFTLLHWLSRRNPP